MRPAPRGFYPRLFIGARLRVYLPVDHGGAPIGVARYLRVFTSIHTIQTSGWFSPNLHLPGLRNLLPEEFQLGI